jgi:hypothetical protein
MSGLDVEALLEASESNKQKQQPDRNNSSPSSTPRPERNGGGSVKSSSSRRDHDRDRRDDRGDRHRRRSRSRESDRYDLFILLIPRRVLVLTRQRTDGVGTPTTRIVMIIMTPRATDIVPATTTDITHRDASVAIETTTMSAIGTITARNAIVRPVGPGARVSAVTVAVAGLALGMFQQTPAYI